MYGEIYLICQTFLVTTYKHKKRSNENGEGVENDMKKKKIDSHF